MTLEAIQVNEKTYIATNTRKAQDGRILCECLMNSLSVAGKAKVNVFQVSYYIKVENEKHLPSGLSLFKVLARESQLDSNSTIKMIRTKLSNLDHLMVDLGNDIVKLNAFVTTRLEALKVRGKTTQDLLTNLFKGYAACSETAYVKYIADWQTERDGWDAADGPSIDVECFEQAQDPQNKRTKGSSD